MYPCKYFQEVFLFLCLIFLCFLPYVTLFPSPVMSVVVFSSSLSLQKGQFIRTCTLKFSTKSFCPLKCSWTFIVIRMWSALHWTPVRCVIFKITTWNTGLVRDDSFLVEEETLMLWMEKNSTNKNWDTDCFVTDGGENNVFYSKPK